MLCIPLGDGPPSRLTRGLAPVSPAASASYGVIDRWRADLSEMALSSLPPVRGATGDRRDSEF